MRGIMHTRSIEYRDRDKFFPQTLRSQRRIFFQKIVQRLVKISTSFGVSPEIVFPAANKSATWIYESAARFTTERIKFQDRVY